MVGLDPSMSMWSKPTEETAAAAAAAGHKHRDDARLDSLDGMMDDFPSSMMPSSANDLPLGDGESLIDGFYQSPQPSDKDRPGLAPSVAKQPMHRRPSMTSPAVMSRTLGDLRYYQSPAAVSRDGRFMHVTAPVESMYSPYVLAGALPQQSHDAASYAYSVGSPAQPYASYGPASPYVSSPSYVAGNSAAYPSGFASAPGQPLRG